jgi:hypothetical protein
MTTLPVAGPDAVVRLTERLVSETRDEVRRADAKAAQWVAAISAGAVAVLASWTTAPPEPWRSGGLVAWLVSGACGCAVVAVVMLTLALVPRTGGGADPRHLAYFGHVHRIGDPDAVRQYLAEGAVDTLPALVTQLCWLSRLAVIKYRYARLGALSGGLAGVLVLLSLI